MGRTGKAVVAVVAFIAGSWLLVCGGLGLLASSGVLEPEEHAITEADRAAVHEAPELNAAFGLDLAPDPDAATWTKIQKLNGAWELECEHEQPGFYLAHHLYLEQPGTDVAASWTGLKIGVDLIGSGMEMQDASDQLDWGDDSECQHMLNDDGDRIGIVCIGRKGTRMFLFSAAGVMFDVPGQVQELLASELAALETWDPHASVAD